MLRGLYTAAFGMKQSQVRQDVTANNIANATTTGFKSDEVVSEPFKEVMLKNTEDDEFGEPAAHKLGPMPFGVQTEGIYTDFVQGTPVQTGRDMDFAINGPGFFNVRYFDGIRDYIMYTRDGSFNIDKDGNVINSDGAFLQAVDARTGETGSMKLGGGKITVDPEGNVYEDSVKKYTLLVSDFNDYNGVEKYGRNLYAQSAGGAAAVNANPGTYQISQGSLEQSNVDMSTEMVDMITNLRSYQANQRVVQSIDETLSKTVNELGLAK